MFPWTGQEESRSISENVKWGHRKRFADGKVSIPFGQFLGFDRGEDGGLVINSDEAVIVKKIYRLFLEGLTPHTIAKKLTTEKLPTPGGQEKWHQGTIKSILRNEKYKGDDLVQKGFTVDFLTKKQKINEGEVPQYYVENSHEAIINPQAFELVQQELTKRLQAKGRYSGVDMFSSKIKCGECGCFYGAKVWHSNSKYRRTVYQCNHKFSTNKKCLTPHFTDGEIKQLFVQAANQLLDEKKEIIANLELIRKTVFDNTALEIEQKKLQEELTVLVQVIQNCVDENARIAQDQEEYLKRYNGLVKKYESLKARFEEVAYKISDNLSRNETTELFIKTLKKQESLITEFDGVLWGSLLDYITVNTKEDVRFIFKDGTEIKA